MKKKGFTIIELTITVTIMGILLVIGIVNLIDSQLSARDSERKIDIQTIATALETYYYSGTDGSTVFGTYPTTAQMADLQSQKVTLRDINHESLIAPLAPSDKLTSLIPATNNVPTASGALPHPEDYDEQYQYVYQPLNSDGSLCTSGTNCQSYILYYASETDGVIHLIKSKNQ